MTYHDMPAYQAADHSLNYTYREQRTWLEFLHYFPSRHEESWVTTIRVAPLEQSSWNREPDHLASVILQERLCYLKALESLGFKDDTSMSILRYWVTINLNAPTGGPYDLLGVVLAAIAELGEPDLQTCYGGNKRRDRTNKIPKPEWEYAFAQALNNEALRSIWRAGVYLAPSFTKAKWIVYRMVMRRWEDLKEGKGTIHMIGNHINIPGVGARYQDHRD
ncbi:hypothetical protein F5Y19DRAFT_489477 [Xylariaceae sp. FL1651]|nr:hypothetical protein F5Y19DRAFT_489477 [Xylariaceae sp. FL1651]